MKTCGVMAFASALMLANPLAAVKLRVDGFGGFDDPPLRKTPIWHVKVFPEQQEDRKCLTYSDMEIIVFSSSYLPYRRLIKDSEIPAVKSTDIVKKKTFKLTSAPQEIDLGDISESLFLNVCVTAFNTIWENDTDEPMESFRTIISHSIFPRETFQDIDELRVQFLGMNLFSWALTDSNSSYRYEATAEGKIIFSNDRKSERFPMGYWPSSKWKNIQFKDIRFDKSDPVMKINDLGDTISFSDFRAIVFSGAFGKLRYYDALNNYLRTGLKHVVVYLGKESQEIPILEGCDDEYINIIIVAKQSLSASLFYTADYLLYHCLSMATLSELKNLNLSLVKAQVVNANGQYAPKASIFLEEEAHNGSKKIFTGETSWWNQRSF